MSFPLGPHNLYLHGILSIDLSESGDSGFGRQLTSLLHQIAHGVVTNAVDGS